MKQLFQGLTTEAAENNYFKLSVTSLFRYHRTFPSVLCGSWVLA
jgi:hypothetical protein